MQSIHQSKFITLKIIIGIVAVIIFGSYIIYQLHKDDNKFAQSSEYYEKLAQECKQKVSKNCCMASVKRMQETGSYKVSAHGICNYGYKKETMLCVGSYSWCERKAVNNTSKESF